MTLLQPLETLRQPTGALYRAYTEGEARSTRSAGAGDARGANRDRHRRRAGRRRLLDRPHDRSGAAGARAADRRLLHRPRTTCAARSACTRKEDGDHAARRAAARARDGAHGRGRGHRRRERPHRGARRRAVAVHARRSTTARAARALRHAPAVSGRAIAPTRCSTRPCFHDAMPASTIKPIMAAAFLSDPRGRRALARRRARGDARTRRRAGARQPARPADALRLGALPRSHVLRRQGLRRLRAAVGGAGDGARVRLERRLRRARARLAASTTCCSAAPLDAPRRERARAGADCESPTAGCSSEPARRQARRAVAPACRRSRSTPATLRRCAAGADGRRLSDDDWEKCRGGVVVDVVAEGWGQGHARASALGVAGMMATLAAAANGAEPRAAAASRRGGARRRGAASARRSRPRRCACAGAAAPLATPLAHDAAEVILSGLSFSHRAGTARTRVRAGVRRAPLPRHRLDRRQDRHADLSQRRPLARRARAAVRRGRASPADSQARRRAARCGRTSGTSRPTAATARATAALDQGDRRADRAQLARGHAAASTAPATRGPNPAAEIALQIVGRATGFIEGSAP